MLSFLRARSSRSSPPNSPLRDWQWSGHALALKFDPAFAGELVALDLDGTFFSDTKVAEEGSAVLAFGFPPGGETPERVGRRRGPPGERWASEPLAIHFGQSGAVPVARD